MLYALVVLIHDTRIETTLFATLLEARKAAAKRVIRLMRESSAVDLGEEVFLMSEAHERNDYDAVVHLFERQVHRQVVFIQTVAVPHAASLPLAAPVAG